MLREHENHSEKERELELEEVGVIDPELHTLFNAITLSADFLIPHTGTWFTFQQITHNVSVCVVSEDVQRAFSVTDSSQSVVLVSTTICYCLYDVMSSCVLVQWDLVCGDYWKVPLQHICFMAGWIFGYVLLGTLCDWLGLLIFATSFCLSDEMLNWGPDSPWSLKITGLLAWCPGCPGSRNNLVNRWSPGRYSNDSSPLTVSGRGVIPTHSLCIVHWVAWKAIYINMLSHCY